MASAQRTKRTPRFLVGAILPTLALGAVPVSAQVVGCPDETST